MLNGGPEADAEELLELGQSLRAELLVEEDVEAITPLGAGEAPEGAKGIEVLAFGGLAIKLVGLASPALRSVVETIEGWLGRQPERSVKLSLDGDTLELTGVSSEDQSRLVDQWIARHAEDG